MDNDCVLCKLGINSDASYNLDVRPVFRLVRISSYNEDFGWERRTNSAVQRAYNTRVFDVDIKTGIATCRRAYSGVVHERAIFTIFTDFIKILRHIVIRVLIIQT